MALPVIHICQFHPKDQDIRVAGTEVDGGSSLSGISQPTQTDGGGYWMADFTNLSFGGRSEKDRADSLAWRAANAQFQGGGRAIVPFCDRWHQPVTGLVGHGPFTDSDGASASVRGVVNGEAGGLNCTILDISFVGEKPLLGGERFTHVHATWRDRCYEIGTAVEIGGGYRLTFLPGIRGGIAVGDALDFTNPRCVMRRISQPSNALSQGLFGSGSLQLVEDMRQPT
jgi:hypothetical protein